MNWFAKLWRKPAEEVPLRAVTEHLPVQELTPYQVEQMRGMQNVYPGASITFGTHVPATDFSRLQSEVSSIARHLEQQASNTHALNLALGEFREKLIVPLREELKGMRYNLGAKVEQSTTELNVLTHHLERIFTNALKAQGWSDAQIDAHRQACGIDSLSAPRAAEFAAYADQIENWKQANEVLTAQNARLITEIESLRKEVEELRGKAPAQKRKRRHGT